MSKKDKERTSAKRLVTMVDVEVDLVGDARALRRLDGLGAEEGRERDKQEPEREPAEDHGGGRRERVSHKASN